MTIDHTEAALRTASETRTILLRSDAVAEVAHVFASTFGGRPALVVADSFTYAAAGEAVQQQLSKAGIAAGEPLLFGAPPVFHADWERVLAIEAALQGSDAIPIAVGSGTVNDLTKLAAHRARRPYMVVGTAASMDGYTAYGAGITRDGFKLTYDCPAPVAVVADLSVLTSAPLELTASGYADLLGKVTAGADWLVADALEVEPIDPTVWPTVQHPLRQWLSGPHRLRERDPAAMANLVEGLLLTGLAMQAARSSRPASGSEHQFSHLWEMQGVAKGGQEPSHGFKVGIGTLAITALCERLLARDFTRLDIAALCAVWPAPQAVERRVRATHTDPVLVEKAVDFSLAKHPTQEQLAARLRLLKERWPSLRERLRAQLIPAAELRQMLQAAGCPVEPEAIGLSQADLRASYVAARQIRPRYTVLDMAAEAGCLEDEAASVRV